MEKINSLTSADVVAENIQTLLQLFPTIAKEGAIDFNELKALLGETIEIKEDITDLPGQAKARHALKPTNQLRQRYDHVKRPVKIGIPPTMFF